MTTTEQIETLKAKHAKLEAEIQDENKRPNPDFIHISELKREKLRVKDEIARMTR